MPQQAPHQAPQQAPVGPALFILASRSEVMANLRDKGVDSSARFVAIDDQPGLRGVR
jgi:hypothetical protein